MEKSTFEALGGSYIRVGDYLFPDLIITDSTPLGKWGQQKSIAPHSIPVCFSLASWIITWRKSTTPAKSGWI